MDDPFDPTAMSPEERGVEVVGLLARGLIRLSAARASEPRPSTGKALDVPGDPGPSMCPG